MPPKCIVHVGDPKTGSTAIQSVMHTETYSATGGKIAYAKTGTGRNRNHTFLWEAASVRPLARAGAMLWMSLAQEYIESDADVFVISCEMFSYLDPLEFRGLLDQVFGEKGYEVVKFVRPHTELSVSLFTESLRNLKRNTHIFNFVRDHMRRDHIPNQSVHNENWRVVFEDNLRLIPFDPVGYQFGIVDRFFEVITEGTDITVSVDRIPGRNERMYQHQAELMSLYINSVQGSIKNTEARGFLLATLSNLTMPGVDTERKITLTQEEVDMIEARCLEDAQRLDMLMDTDFFTGAFDRARKTAIDKRESVLSDDFREFFSSFAQSSARYFLNSGKHRIR